MKLYEETERALFLARHQLAAQRKAASHIQEEAMDLTQIVAAVEVIWGDRNKLLCHVKSMRTVKTGIYGLMMLWSLRLGSNSSSAV